MSPTQQITESIKNLYKQMGREVPADIQSKMDRLKDVEAARMLEPAPKTQESTIIDGINIDKIFKSARFSEGSTERIGKWVDAIQSRACEEGASLMLTTFVITHPETITTLQGNIMSLMQALMAFGFEGGRLFGRAELQNEQDKAADNDRCTADKDAAEQENDLKASALHSEMLKESEA